MSTTEIEQGVGITGTRRSSAPKQGQRILGSSLFEDGNAQAHVHRGGCAAQLRRLGQSLLGMRKPSEHEAGEAEMLQCRAIARIDGECVLEHGYGAIRVSECKLHHTRQHQYVRMPRCFAQRLLACGLCRRVVAGLQMLVGLLEQTNELTGHEGGDSMEGWRMISAVLASGHDAGSLVLTSPVAWVEPQA